MTGTTRVLIVDDDPIVCSGLRLMLGGAADLVVVGEASDGDQVIAAVTELEPDVVLMDIRMPRVDGLAALRLLQGQRLFRGIPVIMLTTFRADADVLEALRSGASGFLLKHTPPAEIVDAVRKAAQGDPAVSPAVLRQLIDHVIEPPSFGTEGGNLARLSDKEREVAFAVAEGLNNTEIAQRLYMSLGTVKSHISSSLSKLGVENRIQLAIMAHDERNSF
ncbi:response regulator [Paenarthrobacter sp. NPDC091711]|uniref:response regulator transcription factor n=1 Tax=Paenarthrobacter sp. NPDC091711 TaxID=3364385 RepID=UPI00382BF352